MWKPIIDNLSPATRLFLIVRHTNAIQIILFLMGKSKNILNHQKNLGTTRVQVIYTRGPNEENKKKRKENKKTTSPSQSNSPIYNPTKSRINQASKPVHSIQIYPGPKVTKKSIIHPINWNIHIAKNKTFFLPNCQKMQRGSAIQSFSRLLPTKNRFQDRNIFQIEIGKTQPALNRAKSRFQRTLAFEQWTSKWSTISSPSLQRNHLLATALPLLF